MIILPPQDIELNQKIDYDGKELVATELFTDGNTARNSGLEYFMVVPRGVIGFKEEATNIIREDD